MAKMTSKPSDKKYEQLLHPALDKKEVVQLDELYGQLREVTTIELEKLDGQALALILKGHTHPQIAKILSKKVKTVKSITPTDVKNFIDKYRSTIKKLANSRDSKLMKTYLENRGNLMGELADLAFATRQLINDYNEEKDNQSTIAAIKVMNNILMNYAKLEGFTDEKPNVNVTMKFDKLVQNTGMEQDEFTKKLLDQADKILDVNFDVMDEVEVIKADVEKPKKVYSDEQEVIV